MANVFLSARWRHLLMLNYEVDPALILPRLPPGTELDLWQGRCLVSLVGFLFSETKLKGIPIPFHQNFEELNLRYYIKRVLPNETRRAVGFVKEIVPRWAVATVAKFVYNENYVCCPMKHRLTLASGETEDAFDALDENVAEEGLVEYSWEEHDRWHKISARRSSPWEPLAPGSEAEFIAEHYWGYAAQGDGGCIEYEVQHVPWNASTVDNVVADVDFEKVYGKEWAPFLQAKPASAFLADGSTINVCDGVKIL